jgi:hypothetical protein
VYSVQEAAELLPGGTDKARAWLVAMGLVLKGPGDAEVVFWGDVVEALQRSSGRLAADRRRGGVAVTMAPRR